MWIPDGCGLRWMLITNIFIFGWQIPASGFPQDCIDHIFERFFRVDKARSREVGGTGLGLAITKNVIQMHHGIIDAESAPGEGTTFSVRIPLNYVPRQEEKS